MPRREKKMKVDRIGIIKPINEPTDVTLVAISDFLDMAKINSYQELTGTLREMGWKLVLTGTDGKMATRFRKSETSSTWTNDNSILKIWKGSNGLILTFENIEVFCQFDKNQKYEKLVKEETEMKEEDKNKNFTNNVNIITGTQNKINYDSNDNSINNIGDLQTDLVKLRGLIEKNYQEMDKDELIRTVDQMKQSCNDPSKKNLLKEKLGGILKKTAEVSTISSLVITLLKNYFS